MGDRVGVAAAYAAATLLLIYPSLAIPFRLVGLKVSDVLLKLMPSIATAAVMAGEIEIMVVAWDANTNNELLRLSLLVVVGIVTYVGLSLIAQRAFLKDLIRTMINR